jgi:phage shock protein E
MFNIFNKPARNNEADLKKLVELGAVILDVRTTSEFQEGHIKGSKNIPLQDLPSSINIIGNSRVITVCRSGARSAAAIDILHKAGIEAYNGGSWLNLNKIIKK